MATAIPRVDRKFRVARLWSNRELRKVAGLFSGDVVNVSAGEDVDKEGATYSEYFPNRAGYWLTNYSPGAFRGFEGRDNEFLFDLTADVPEELRQRFDVAFNHTTLEHIFDVRRAFQNLSAVSRDVVIVVVPFAQVEHESPGYNDYWRFTPRCLRTLFEENGLEVVYEAANNDFNAAVYLFFVGSLHPDRWHGKFPDWAPIGEAGAWIGKSHVSDFRSLLRPLVNMRFRVASWLKRVATGLS